MIDGVEIKKLIPHTDDRGYLQEILRCDDEIFDKFGQVYVSMNYPGVIRAWHFHKKQTDYFTVLKGSIKVGLYDARPDSPTNGEAQAVYIGESNRILLKIPVGVYHGYKTVGTEPSLLLNFPTEPFDPEDPDEYRAPYDSPEIPFDWDVKFT